MKIGLVGWGIEAQSAFKYYGNSHQYIIVNEEPRDDFPVGKNITVYSLNNIRQPGLVGNISDLSYLDHLENCDLVIYQPSAAKNLEKHFPTESNFWKTAKTIQHILFEQCPSRNIIGVTGTKGKGTTTTLIAKMIEASDMTVHVGGNIGVPSLDLLPNIQQQDYVVLELSSFQLYKFPYSPHIAVHLMMMPEHIDEWHKTMDDYVEAKRNIFAHQKEDDIAVYYPANDYSTENAAHSKGKHIPYTTSPGAFIDDAENLSIGDKVICHISELKLLGAHNIQNICAATTAVWQIHQNIEAFRSVLTTFSGLEHRLQLAGDIDGVRYYDDSFGTTPDTAIVAMDAFTENKVMIVGGHDKGNPMKPMTERLSKDDIRHVVFIGTTGASLRSMAIAVGLDPAKTSFKADGNSWTMDKIVAEAKSHAHVGDVVLLSTGCASFGLFQDYKDRGIQFQNVVKSLIA